MTIPFLDLFKKAKSRFFQVSPAPAPRRGRPAPVAKQSGERLSKTVMPNVTRSSTAPDPFQVAAGSLPGVRVHGRDLPPMVAFALEPQVERAISLQLSDFLDQMPSGYAKSAESFDANRRILLKASEIEKGMANGKPSVSLSSIYAQAPEIFLHNLAPDDATHVPLPYDKVLEQFQSVQVRADQTQDQDIPQLETPILQVTLEDTERFGTSVDALQTSALPPVKVETATAKTLSTAEPEPVAHKTVARAKTRPRRGIPLSDLAPTTNKPSDPTAPPTRIPFELPPNGTGAPASERVPASSGPPVPTRLPTAPAPPHIPLKVPPPCADLRPKLTLVPGVEPKKEIAAAKSASKKKDGQKIALSLHVVMQNVPSFQLSGSPSGIPEDARIEFPFSLIEPQLASGRVALAPKTFQAAIPQSYRDLFVIDPTETSVLLPLQEVLKNIPATALQMREDQEEVEAVNLFETPFSIKADEDAKLFRGSEAAVSKATEEPAVKSDDAARAPEKIESPPVQTEAAPEPAAKIDTPRERKNEAKEIVGRASGLPGVAACAVTFADGLTLAGNLPAEVAADGLCAMAPSLLQRIERHMLDTKLGALTAVTLHCEKSPVTFFMQGNICLTVLHAGEELQLDTQKQLAEMAKELSRVYTQPETAHVDH